MPGCRPGNVRFMHGRESRAQICLISGSMVYIGTRTGVWFPLSGRLHQEDDDERIGFTDGGGDTAQLYEEYVGVVILVATEAPTAVDGLKFCAPCPCKIASPSPTSPAD